MQLLGGPLFPHFMLIVTFGRVVALKALPCFRPVQGGPAQAMCAHPAVASALGRLFLFLSTIQRCVKGNLVNQGSCPLELKSLDVFHLWFSSPWVPEGLPLVRLPGFPRAGGAACTLPGPGQRSSLVVICSTGASRALLW